MSNCPVWQFDSFSGLLCYTATGASGEGRGFGLTSPPLNALLNVSRSLPINYSKQKWWWMCKSYSPSPCNWREAIKNRKVTCHQGDQIWWIFASLPTFLKAQAIFWRKCFFVRILRVQKGFDEDVQYFHIDLWGRYFDIFWFGNSLGFFFHNLGNFILIFWSPCVPRWTDVTHGYLR